MAAVLALDFFTRSKPACGFALFNQPDFRIVWAGGKVLSPGECNTGFGGPNAPSAPAAMHAPTLLFLHQCGKSTKRHLPVWNLIGSYLIRVGCWILLCRKRTPQIYGSITYTAARSAMRSGSGFVRHSSESPLGSLHSCNCWSIDLPNSMVRQHPRSYPVSRICFRSENHRTRARSRVTVFRDRVKVIAAEAEFARSPVGHEIIVWA